MVVTGLVGALFEYLGRRNLQTLEAIANMEQGAEVTPEAQELFNKLKKKFSKKKAG